MASLRNPAAVALVMAACATPPARAQEPSREPILRIETGMHTAAISRIGVDAAGQFLVTASHDKTVRVWELATGRLLRTVRPPIGEGNEGELYAVALSPDGQTIAAGGWTQAAQASYNLYLFDRASGRLLRRIGGLPNGAGHLVFSHDGAQLAAALQAGQGVRLFRVADGTEIGQDRAYGSDSYDASFDRGGRLVTSCLDGFLRLYDPSLRLLTKVAAPGGKRPYSVRFSPDGTKVAVGYEDSTRVDVLSGADLRLLYSPDVTGVDKVNLGSVTWSADGAELYAGGRYWKTGAVPVRRWADAGRGRYRDLPAANSTIMDLAPLRQGGLVFGAADPAWGVLSAAGERARFVSGPIAGHMANWSGFLVDDSGSRVRFGYEVFGKSPAVFSLADRTLTLNPAADARLTPPRTEAPGLAITHWDNTTEPKLNDIKLHLEQYEISRSLAIAPDGQRFLLGTEWFLRLFDRSGREQWRVPVPGIAWAVNVSGDGRLAAAALADGTIRWYRMRDGKELLTLFPHADKKRWVLWTPKGYYDASPGAEDLIGWHVNNGKDAAADFFPVSQFRSTYYRPDVIARVLQTGDEQEALRLVNEESGRKQQQASLTQMLPPVIAILSPADGAEVSSPEVIVRYSVRSPSGEPVTTLRALVDGRPVEAGRRLEHSPALAGDVREARVTLPERDCEVSLIAENRHAASVPATVRVRWRGRAAEAFVVKPRLYVLAIGVGRYANKDFTLGFPAKDARDFAAVLEAQRGGLYRDVVTKVLTDEQATKDEILDGLDWIRKETTSKDVAMVFLAGHGVNDPTGNYYFCPHNVDPDRLLRTGVPFSDIKTTVQSIAGKALFFVDTCHSGNVMGARRAIGTDITGLVNELASAENGAVVFAASTGRQYSLENAEWGNGAFTKALVEGLSGKADYTGAGRITINMLDLYLSERVKELTKGRQTPTTTKPQTVPDFPVALRR